jgi:hypothetical protein
LEIGAGTSIPLRAGRLFDSGRLFPCLSCALGFDQRDDDATACRREVGQANHAIVGGGHRSAAHSAAAWIAARYRVIARRVGLSDVSIADPRDRDQPAALATAETVRRCEVRNRRRSIPVVTVAVTGTMRRD